MSNLNLAKQVKVILSNYTFKLKSSRRAAVLSDLTAKHALLFIIGYSQV